MDEETLSQTIQTARDLCEEDRPEVGSCCVCKGIGDWSITREDFICQQCVRMEHATEHRY